MLQQPSLEKAQQLILETVSTLPVEYILLNEAPDRILAENLVAEKSLPPYSQSAVDGFALGDGIASINSQFEITGYLNLDEFSLTVLGPGQAMGVFTGGILPEGTLSVIPHEKTAMKGNTLTVLEPIKPFNNIKQAGEDFLAGSLLLERGARLDAGAIALLAALGINQIPVYRRPRVAILNLGQNVAPYQQAAPGQSLDSNTPMLAALVKRDGGTVIATMSSTDSECEVSALWEQADLLIATGATYTMGSGVNGHIGVIEAEPLYQGVPIMPGSHSYAAHCGARLFLSLSGNPAACAVCYHLFAAPALRAMQGINASAPYIQARCVNSFGKKSGTRRFIRAHAIYSAKGWEVTILPGQKPSMIRSLLSCNALIDVPADSPPIEAGAEVSVMLLDNIYAS